MASSPRSSKQMSNRRAAPAPKAGAKAQGTKRPARKKAGVKKPAAAKPATAPGPRFRSGAVVRTGLVVATVGAGLALAAIPVGDWMDQQAELDQAEERRVLLETEIEGIEREIAVVTGVAGIEARGRCFGMYVWPGAETYAVPGVSGCVETGG